MCRSACESSGAWRRYQRKVKIPDDQLEPAARQVREKLRQEIDTNWRHITPSEGLFRLCTTMDPRYKMTLWDADTRASIKKVIIELVVKYAGKMPDEGVAVDVPIAAPASKRGRKLQKQDSFADFQADMREALGKSAVPGSSEASDIKAKVRKQSKWFIEGPCLEEMADPYALWAAQGPSHCSLLIPLARRFAYGAG